MITYTFHKDYVIDYTDPPKRVVMEAEKGAGWLITRPGKLAPCQWFTE